MIDSINLSALTNNVSLQLDSYSELRLYAYIILIKYPDPSRKHKFNSTHWEKSSFNVNKSGVEYGE